MLKGLAVHPMRLRGHETLSPGLVAAHSLAVRWDITALQGTQIALALDASALGMRFVVLAVSVVYRGCAHSGGLDRLACGRAASLVPGVVAPAASAASGDSQGSAAVLDIQEALSRPTSSASRHA
jgi:hypothetical protein